jgi:hypothetical protein
MKVYADKAQSGGDKIMITDDSGNILKNIYLDQLPGKDGTLIFESNQ